jgi:hypothetical protein
MANVCKREMMKMQKNLFTGILFLGLLFPLILAAAAEDNVAMKSDFIHISRENLSSCSYQQLHAFLKECSWQEKNVLINGASGPEAMTLLHQAVMQRDFAKIYFLFKHRADRTLKLTNGDTAFDMAKKQDGLEKAFFDFYLYSSIRIVEQESSFTKSQLAEVRYSLFKKLTEIFLKKAPDWYQLEELLFDYPREWIRNDLLSSYNPSGKTLLCKAIELDRLDWIIFLLNHNANSHCMIKDTSATYKDIIRLKTEKCEKSEKHNEHCFDCDVSQKIEELLEVYESCFEIK